MHSKIKLILFSALSCSVSAMAQENVVTTGSDVTNSTHSTSYSIGQVFYTTTEANGAMSAAGIQQSYLIEPSSNFEAQMTSIEIRVYPNPTTDKINITIEDVNNEDYSFALYDLQGKILKESNLVDQDFIFMSEFPPSNYVLLISQGKAAIRSFQIIKK